MTCQLPPQGVYPKMVEGVNCLAGAFVAVLFGQGGRLIRILLIFAKIATRVKYDRRVHSQYYKPEVLTNLKLLMRIGGANCDRFAMVGSGIENQNAGRKGTNITNTS